MYTLQIMAVLQHAATAPLHQCLKLEGLLLALSRNGTEIKGGTAGPAPKQCQKDTLLAINFRELQQKNSEKIMIFKIV